MSVQQQEDRYRHDGPWTEDEFLALPEDRYIELLDGALLMSPYAGSRHQRLSSRLWRALEAARPSGMEVLETVNVRIGPNRILIPDLVVVTRLDDDVTVFDAADVVLVVEIVSPGSVAADRAIKPRLYAEAGIPGYLRVELSGPTALPHRLRDGRYVCDEPGPVLRLTEPFAAEVDLAALLTADRPPTGDSGR
ncbi:MAG: Uma2 family endonuclease [Pseudonocardia sp.]